MLGAQRKMFNAQFIYLFITCHTESKLAATHVSVCVLCTMWCTRNNNKCNVTKMNVYATRTRTHVKVNTLARRPIHLYFIRYMRINVTYRQGMVYICVVHYTSINIVYKQKIVRGKGSEFMETAARSNFFYHSSRYGI